MVLIPGFQSTRLVTEGALEPFFFLYTDDSIQGNPETCKQSNVMLNYEVKNKYEFCPSFSIIAPQDFLVIFPCFFHIEKRAKHSLSALLIVSDKLWQAFSVIFRLIPDKEKANSQFP